LARTVKEESFTALLILQALREHAISLGNREIRSAAKLGEELDSVERDYPDLLADGSSWAAEIGKLRESIVENRAFQALTEILPGFKKKIFDSAKDRTVAKTFRVLRSRIALEILADGFLVACLFVVIRVLMGEAIAGDGFGALSARLTEQGGGAGDAKTFLFANFAATALVWIGLRSSARRLSKRLFGK
jgi:hypothetical protein